MDTDSSFLSGYKLGGALEFNDPTYVRRDADNQLYQALKQGEFCYILNSRQTGKSSLKVNLLHQLRKEGIACADIDLTRCIETETTPEQFYLDFIVELIESLTEGEVELDFNRRVWWQEHNDLSLKKRLGCFIQQIILKQVSQNLVIFVDEIDSILTLDVRSNFFALIRSFYNSRSIESDYKRLTFVLLGVATPSDLIKDKKVTPFNIGKAIVLKGFTASEVEPLTRGLVEKVDDPSAVMTEILYWTGGQPFLTQRLCNLIVNSFQRIVAGKERELVKQIVESSIINNWEAQDEKVHLKTIRDRLLNNEKKTIYLLGLYRQILQKEEIEVRESSEEMEMQLSGLVVKEGGKLRIYNPIYAAIFNEPWIDSELAKLRPYALSIQAWLMSNGQDTSRLLRGSSLKEALEWSKDKQLSSQDYKYLNESQQSLNIRRLKAVLFTAGGILVGILGSWLWYNYKYASCPIGERLLTDSKCVRKIVSSGEKSKLFLGRTNVDLERGVDDFQNKKYEEAYKRFEQAKKVDPSDPVPYIYSNNAQARLKIIEAWCANKNNKIRFTDNNPVLSIFEHRINQAQKTICIWGIETKIKPWKLVAVVGIDFFEDTASEILRGVADSQDEFNRAGGKDGRLLEIVIANDGNRPEFSEKLANELVNYQDILGIIGHPASESTEKAIHTYNEKNLAMVSPTSSSSELKANVFFRPIQSTMEASELYSNYIKNNMSLYTNKLKVFYNTKQLYSTSLKEDFKEDFKKQFKLDLDDDNFDTKLFSGDDYFDIRETLKQLENKKVEVIFLIPSLDSTSLTVAFTRVYNEYFKNKNKKIKILSSMSLSEAAIMPRKTTSSFNGLILARPCVNEESSYVKGAKQRWQLNTTSWRTTAGYDATQVFVKAIREKSPQTREDMLDALKSITLSKEESSGFGLEWSQNQSNINRPYCMYEVYQGKLIEVKVKTK